MASTQEYPNRPRKQPFIPEHRCEWVRPLVKGSKKYRSRRVVGFGSCPIEGSVEINGKFYCRVHSEFVTPKEEIIDF